MPHHPNEGNVALKGILAEFRDALEEEIDKIKKSGQSSTLLYAGRQIESHGADLWYRFNIEYVIIYSICYQMCLHFVSNNSCNSFSAAGEES